MGYGALLAAVIAGGGAYMASQNTANAANNASSQSYYNTLAQINAQQAAENKAYQYNQPYNLAGLLGIQGLTGQYGSAITDTSMDYGLLSSALSQINQANQQGVDTTYHLSSPTGSTYNIPTGGQGTGSTGLYDATGGANQYMQNISGMSLPNFPDLNIPNFSYSFNENDPGYQFKLQQSQKAIDAATASRGNYNSRAAINAISDAQQAITADEVSSQFNRAKDIYGLNSATSLSNYGADYSRLSDLYNLEYGKNTGLYNMSSQLGNTNYQQLLDLIKIGQGSAASAGNTSVATGQGISNAYGNLSNAQQQASYVTGQAGSDFWSGLAPAAMNAYQLYSMNNNQSTTYPGYGNNWYDYY